MTHQRQAGVALLISLWALALLSLLMAAIVSAVRLENRQSSFLLQQTRAHLVAESGIALAVARLSSGQGWPGTGKALDFNLDDSHVTVQVASELGKVDLNSANPDLCGRLAIILGATSAQAAQLVAALRQRQAAGNLLPLRILEETLQLPGMDSDLFARLQPYITVWSGNDQPLAGLAAPPVLQALGQNISAVSSESDPGQVLTLTSQAHLANGFRVTLRVTLLLTPNEGRAQPYRVLRWQP